MKKYKALIIDLDGTIIAQSVKDGLPTLNVKEALEKAREKIHICIATGRPPTMALHLFDHLKLSGPSIFLNGGLIMDSETQKIIYSKSIIISDFYKIIEVLNMHNIKFTIDELKEYGIEYTNSFKPHKPIAIFVRNIELSQVERIKDDLVGISTITLQQVPDWEHKAKWAIHIGHIEGTKQHGIFEVAKLLNIETHEIIGVGDGYNDFPLLMACGLKVAMGNAVPELKEIADYIAPSVEEDGVAWVIEKFVLNQ